MRQAKKKAVFTADPEQLQEVQAVVSSGRYRSSSEFLREAITEKLDRLRRERRAEQVKRYCDRGFADEDDGLITAQAFDDGE